MIWLITVGIISVITAFETGVCSKSSVLSVFMDNILLCFHPNSNAFNGKSVTGILINVRNRKTAAILMCKESVHPTFP